MKVFFFYDSKFVPLRDYMVASMEACGASSAFELKEDILDDLGGNNRILVAIPIIKHFDVFQDNLSLPSSGSIKIHTVVSVYGFS